MDSTLVLAFMMFGLTLMLAGHITKVKILAFFSVGAWVVLIFEFSNDLLFTVFLAGLILWNTVYAFFGGKFE